MNSEAGRERNLRRLSDVPEGELEYLTVSAEDWGGTVVEDPKQPDHGSRNLLDLQTACDIAYAITSVLS